MLVFWFWCLVNYIRKLFNSQRAALRKEAYRPRTDCHPVRYLKSVLLLIIQSSIFVSSFQQQHIIQAS